MRRPAQRVTSPHRRLVEDVLDAERRQRLVGVGGRRQVSRQLRRLLLPRRRLAVLLEVISASFGGLARRLGPREPSPRAARAPDGAAEADGRRPPRAGRGPGSGPISATAEASRAARGPRRRALTLALPPPGLPAIRGPSRGAPRGAPVSPAPVLFKGVRWLRGGSWPTCPAVAAVGRARREGADPVLRGEAERWGTDYC